MKTKKETRSIKLTIYLMRTLNLWDYSTKKGILPNDTILGIVLFSIIFSIYVQAHDFYRVRHDIVRITYCLPLVVLGVAETAKLIMLIVKRKEIKRLNEFVNKTFWEAEYNDKEIQIFNKCDRLCFKAVTAFIIVVQGTCWSYVLSPLETIGTERKLPFIMYFDFLYVTPYYEITYALQFLGTMVGGAAMITSATYMFTINCFIATQFEMLGLRLQSLGVFEEKKDLKINEILQIVAHRTLKKYIEKHKLLIRLANELEVLFSFVLLGQNLGSIVQIGMAGLQVLLTRQFTSRLTYVSAGFFIANLVQLYFYAYSSHQLYMESEKVSDSMYFSHWYNLHNPKIQKDYAKLIQQVMVRARRPCILTLGKFYPLNLSTFTSVLNTSLSLLTVLRQTFERKQRV